ncbi:NDP-sugar synthase [Candidatus Woesearchaeota archaeon]|nr:NDP-sugar synthase [Candidatus Woesearchaeota archaeon]
MMKSKGIILAGGRGKRMGKLTDEIPKPMIEVCGKPILWWIISEARKEGIDSFVVLTGYLGEKIEDYFGRGSELEVSLDYKTPNLKENSIESEIIGLKPTLDSVFYCFNGDSLVDKLFFQNLDSKISYGQAVFTAEDNVSGTWKRVMIDPKTNLIVGFSPEPPNPVLSYTCAMRLSFLDYLEKGIETDGNERSFAYAMRNIQRDGRRAYALRSDHYLNINCPDDLKKAELFIRKNIKQR